MFAKYTISIAALDKFSAPFKAFGAANDKVKTAIRGQQAELRKLKGVQRDLSGFGQLKQKLDDIRLASKKAAKEEVALAKQMMATEKPTKKLEKAFAKAAAKSHQLNAEYQVQSAKLNKLELSLDRAGVDASQFAREQEKIERSTKQANQALKSQQAQLKSLGAAQAKVDANRAKRADLRGQIVSTAAMGYIAAQPIKAAVNFESSMADVKKVVNFDNDKEKLQMGRAILKLSTAMPIAAEGIADIVAAAGQSGVAKKELLGFASSAAKMATAFDMSAEEAGSTMAGWRASMGLTQVQTIALADATNHLSNKMNAKAPQIAGVLKRQGAVAMSAGLSEIQAASLSAALLSGGAREEVAATALKNITGALMKGDSTTGKKRAAWSQLGFDPGQVSQDMMSDAPKTMIAVFEAMQQVPEAQVSALVSELFGEEVKGSVMPLLKNLDNLRDAFKHTAKATEFKGSMEQEYQVRSATTGNNLKLLSNRFNRLQINLGTLLLPTLNDLMAPIANFTDLLAEGAEKYPQVASAITKVGVGLVALKVGSLALKMVGLSLGQGMNKINLGRAKLSATTGNTARNATMAEKALRRMNATLNQTGRGGYAGYGGGGDGKSDRKGRRKRRFRGGGKWGGAAALLGSVAALPLLTDSLSTPTGESGDATEIGANTGDFLGGLGGGAAGAMAGAALGSVVPVVGTAIGGILGGIGGSIGGSSLGSWVGEAIGGWFAEDKLPAAEAVQKQIATPVTRQMVFNPTITIPASSGNQDDDERMVDRLMQRMQSELMPVMSEGDLAVRLDASLSDSGANE